MKCSRADLATLAILLLVPVAAYFGYFRGHLAQLRTLREQEVQLREDTTAADQTARDLLAARTRARKLAARLDALSASIPGEDQALKAVDAVLRSAHEAHVEVQFIQPDKLLEGHTVNCLPIRLTASAEFKDFYDFLVRIERDKVLLTVQRMELESDPASGKCTVRLDLRAYFTKPAAAPPVKEAAA